MTVLRTGQRVLHIPGIGVRASRRAVSAGGGAVDWSTWFDHCWVAKGAVDLATSCGDLVGSQTLTYSTAPAWSAALGWYNFNGLTAYLLTGLTPAASWSVMVAFANAVNNSDNLYLFGMASYYITTYRDFASGTKLSNGGALNLVDGGTLAGTLGMAGQTAYKNGSSAGAISAGGAPASTIHIGRYNPNGLQTKAEIWAFGIKKATLSGAAMAEAHAAMAAL